MDEYFKFEHEVTKAVWDEEDGKWNISVKHGDHEFVDSCDIFINAGGLLSNWSWPKIPGIDDFRGKLMHSAAWDQNYDFNGKKVAVIGIGSSSIQIVPQLAKNASKIGVYIRSRTWISPAPGINEPTKDDPDMDESYNFTPEVLERFKNDPEYLLNHRKQLADRRTANFRRSMKGSKVQADAQVMFTNSMRERLGESEKGKNIAEILIPDFPVGCRRQTPGPGFLESLMQDNVETLKDNIEKITAKGIMGKDGIERPYDVVVCATGFDTSYRPRFPIIGRNGVDLGEKWTKEPPQSYFGIATVGFPNYFRKIFLIHHTYCKYIYIYIRLLYIFFNTNCLLGFAGPNYPVSNGSLVAAIQINAVYFYHCINKMQTQNIKSLEVRQDACDDYNTHVQEWLKRSVWTAPCSSWYKRGTKDGRVVAVYAGTTFHYINAIKDPRWEDYNYKYIKDGSGVGSNRFAYMGNGFFMGEEEGHWSWGAVQTNSFDDYWELVTCPSKLKPYT